LTNALPFQATQDLAATFETHLVGTTNGTTSRSPVTGILQSPYATHHTSPTGFPPSSSQGSNTGSIYMKINAAAKVLASASMSSKTAAVITPKEAQTAAEVLESAFSPYSQVKGFQPSLSSNGKAEAALASALLIQGSHILTSQDIKDAEVSFVAGPKKVKYLKRSQLLYLTSKMGWLPEDPKARRKEDLLLLLTLVPSRPTAPSMAHLNLTPNEADEGQVPLRQLSQALGNPGLRIEDPVTSTLTGSSRTLVQNLGNSTVPLAPKSSALRSHNKAASKQKILGSNTVREIQVDISKTDLPSWITKPPSDVGTAKCGKLNADQWRTLCTINLVVTLVRLWGNHENQRFQKMLDNFMDLATAVKLGSKRVLSLSTIEDYEEHIFRYVKDMLDLYPWTNMTPNQHLALHFGEHLRRFGPTQSTRTFATERENLRLRNVPTNRKFGESIFTTLDISTLTIMQLVLPLRRLRAYHV